MENADSHTDLSLRIRLQGPAPEGEAGLPASTMTIEKGDSAP